MGTSKYEGYNAEQFRQNLAHIKRQQELLDLKLVQLRNRIREIGEGRVEYLTDWPKDNSHLFTLDPDMEDHVMTLK